MTSSWEQNRKYSAVFIPNIKKTNLLSSLRWNLKSILIAINNQLHSSQHIAQYVFFSMIYSFNKFFSKCQRDNVYCLPTLCSQEKINWCFSILQEKTNTVFTTESLTMKSLFHSINNIMLYFKCNKCEIIFVKQLNSLFTK